MEIFLYFFGLAFFIIGLIFLIRAGFSEQSRYSWKMGLFVGGIAWMIFYFLLRDNGRILLSLPGSFIFSVILMIIGLLFVTQRKKIALVLYKSQLAPLKFILGDLIRQENPMLLNLYKWALIVAGMILILAAFVNYFGPFNF